MTAPADSGGVVAERAVAGREPAEAPTGPAQRESAAVFDGERLAALREVFDHVKKTRLWEPS